jgi:hypothetical protein
MKALFVVAGFSAIVLAQDPGLRARELFYTQPPDAPPIKKGKKPSTPVVSAVNIPLGLRYSVMRRDPDGKFIEVDPDANFHPTDQIRLDVDANSPGYLYVLMQESSGNWSLLSPSPRNRIGKGMPQQIPLALDEQPGTKKLFLLLSRRPEPDLDQVAAKIGADVVTHLRDQVKSLGLMFEKIDEISLKYDGTNDVKTEKATYVVNPNRGDDARLAVDVSLKHGK